jgi:hypothetical protein
MQPSEAPQVPSEPKKLSELFEHALAWANGIKAELAQLLAGYEMLSSDAMDNALKMRELLQKNEELSARLVRLENRAGYLG